MTSSSVAGTWRPRAREHLLTATTWVTIISLSARTTSGSWAFLADSTQSNSRQHGECESVHAARGTILTACSDRPTICRLAGHPPAGTPMPGTLTRLHGNRSERAAGGWISQPPSEKHNLSFWGGCGFSKRCVEHTIFKSSNSQTEENYNPFQAVSAMAKYQYFRQYDMTLKWRSN